MIDNKEIKLKIIEAGYAAVERLIKVAQEDIIKPGEDEELAADTEKQAKAEAPPAAEYTTRGEDAEQKKIDLLLQNIDKELEKPESEDD